MKRKTHKNPEPEIYVGGVNLVHGGRTLLVIWGPGVGEMFRVDPKTRSWTKAAEFVASHFPEFRLKRDTSIAGGHWYDENGVAIELW
jgi:hypothetical protein